MINRLDISREKEQVRKREVKKRKKERERERERERGRKSKRERESVELTHWHGPHHEAVKSTTIRPGLDKMELNSSWL